MIQRARQGIARLQTVDWANLPGANLALKLTQLALCAAVLWFLITELQEMGWQTVLAALPSSPWFYVLFTVYYLAWPGAEWLIYRTLWSNLKLSHMAAFLRKRVYNFALVGYSGEAWFWAWASHKLRLPVRQVFSNVKDNNILSALGSNAMTVAIVMVFLLTGDMQKVMQADQSIGLWLVIVPCCALAIVLGLLLIKPNIIALPARDAWRAFGIHFARLIIMLVVLTLMWGVALPEVSLTTWAMLLAAHMLLTRIPFLPNTDLIFLGLAMSLTSLVDAPEAAVAGMLLAQGALAQAAHLGVYLLTSIPIKQVEALEMEELSSLEPNLTEPDAPQHSEPAAPPVHHSGKAPG